MKLTNFGFSENEEKVYMACLELGMAPISVIAKKANLKRTTVYEVIKKLAKKGVSEYFLKNNVRFYSVISPNKLYNKLKANLRNFQEELPRLNAIHNEIAYKPKVRFYEGREDILRVYLEVINNNQEKEFRNYFMPEQTLDYLGYDWVMKNFIDTDNFRAIKVRTIAPHTSKDLSEINTYKNREMRVIKDPNVSFKNEVYIYDNKVATFSFDEDFAFVIESKKVADTEKAIFDLAWESAGLL